MFGEVEKKIAKHQAGYVKRYNKRHNVSTNESGFSVGDKVQYVNGRKKSAMGHKLEGTFLPPRAYVLIFSVNNNTNTCKLKDPKTGEILCHYRGKREKSFPFDQIVPFIGTLEIKEVVKKKKIKKILKRKYKKKITDETTEAKTSTKRKKVTTSSGRKTTMFKF